MMYWHDGSFGWFGWAVMVLSMTAFWGLLVWAAVSLVRSIGHSSQDREAPGPEDVLAGRFARGEIDEEDYRQRTEVLRRQRFGSA